MLGADVVDGVDSVVRVPGVEVGDIRGFQLGEIRVRCSDLTFRLDAATDLEQLIAAAPARWALSSLAEDPEDETRRERAVAAVRAAAKGLPDGPAQFDLAVVRLDGGEILGSVIVLFGKGTGPDARIAYVLTPDVGLADLLAADSGRLATEFVDGLAPSGSEVEWRRGVREFLLRFGALLRSSGAAASGLVIVRAEPSQPPLAGRRERVRPGAGRRTGGLLGRALGRFGPAPVDQVVSR